jgi:ATP-dependent exoDNAse (exonuclease V) beta subunit
MNKRTPIDQPARNRALDIGHSFAVSAPAGSGKTGLLTQRVLGLLAHCDEPENILAITFTKKAASEMQARILDALRDAEQHTTEPEDDYLKATWHLAQAVLRRNHEKQWELFSCPNRLRVTTIDSLCRSISQQMPFESQLGHTPEILDNPHTAYRLAARDTLKQLTQSGELQTHLTRLIQHFDNKLDRIETLLVQLLTKRDQWLGPMLQSKDQRHILEMMLTEVIEEQLHMAQDTLAPIASELGLLADHAAQQLQASSSPINACLGLCGLPDTHIDAVPQWLGIKELLLTQKGELRKSATKAIGFLAPSDKSLSKEQQGEAKVAKQRMGELFAQCKEMADVEKHVNALANLPSARYEEKQWQLLDSLNHVLLDLALRLQPVFQQLGKTDYLAVTLAALDALGEADSPSDLALALDYKIQHILVDEFQDTSSTQLTLLERLTAGWQPNDGRTLFVVGDAMQSCYRFRDANVGIFLNAREYGIGDIHLEPLDLQVNFRSQEGIVKWVNQSFTHIFPALNDSNRGAVSYSPSISFNAALDTPAVQTHLLAYNDKLPTPRKHEAHTVVNIIQRSQAQAPNDSIALLVRSKAHAQEIIYALNDANIAYQATDIDRLDTCMPVLDCLSLTKALLYPNDRLAWLSLLRAPWCGLDMHDLLAVAEYGKHNKRWPLLIDTIMQSDIALSSSGQKKLTRFSHVIQQALAQQKRQSLRRWIHGTWLALGGAGLLIDPSDIDNVHTFFGVLDHYEQGATIPQWQDVEKAVNELYAKPQKTHSHTGIPPVDIMSIHKSKGLEFDTVIIPALDKKPRSSDKELILWLERIAYSPKTHQQEAQLLISPVNATGDNNDPIYQFIQQQHTEKEQLESDRVLYVGCTRAVKQLHLVAYAAIDSKLTDDDPSASAAITYEQLKVPSKQSLLARLWPTIANSHANDCHMTPCDIPATHDEHPFYNKNSHPNIIISLHDDWQAPTIRANTLLKDYRGNNALAKNNAGHMPIAQTDFFDEADNSHANVNDKKNNNTAPAARENIAKPDALLQREQRYIGTVIHLALQHITDTDDTQWHEQRIQQQQPFWRTQLIQAGISPLNIANALEKVTLAVRNTLNDTQGQWLLNNQHKNSATEYELWNHQGQHIIDRTFVEAETRWIIDYKSSQPSEEQSIEQFLEEEKQQYTTQLQRYRSLFRDENTLNKSALNKNTTVKTALYFPLLPYLLVL